MLRSLSTKFREIDNDVNVSLSKELAEIQPTFRNYFK